MHTHSYTHSHAFTHTHTQAHTHTHSGDLEAGLWRGQELSEQCVAVLTLPSPQVTHLPLAHPLRWSEWPKDCDSGHPPKPLWLQKASCGRQ